MNTKGKNVEKIMKMSQVVATRGENVENMVNTRGKHVENMLKISQATTTRGENAKNIVNTRGKNVENIMNITSLLNNNDYTKNSTHQQSGNGNEDNVTSALSTCHLVTSLCLYTQQVL